jgi:hypothetical protein
MTNTKSINIAILAMGGEGGGVLADWGAVGEAVAILRNRRYRGVALFTDLLSGFSQKRVAGP